MTVSKTDVEGSNPSRPARKVKGYLCNIAWDYEIGNAMDGTIIYPTIVDIPYHEGCGVTEVEVTFVRQVKKDTWGNASKTRKRRNKVSGQGNRSTLAKGKQVRKLRTKEGH